jgi:hypothetical protein
MLDISKYAYKNYLLSKSLLYHIHKEIGSLRYKIKRIKTMKIRTLLMISSLAVISSFFIGSKEAKSQQIQCDQYGNCYQLQVFCDGYGRCYQQWTPYNQNQQFTEDDWNRKDCAIAFETGADLALMRAYVIDCTRYGYPPELTERGARVMERFHRIR